MDWRIRSGRKVAKISVIFVFALSLVTSPTWAQTGTVTGRVVDADGEPFAGVLVSLQNADGSATGKSTTSDGNGNFRIPGVAPGSYTVRATADGFQPATQIVELSADGEVAVDFAMSPMFREALIVSAQRVDEDILDVPMTISAFDTQAMEEMQLQTRVDLQDLTPGLQFGDGTQQNGHNTVIRGIGTKDQAAHQDRAVAVYVDGAYTLGNFGVAPGGAFDMQRVEVARGPQGTLHGKNSIAGSINMVNIKPENRWDATLMGEYNDWSQYRFNAAVGGPIAGPVSFRITGGTHQGDGIQENIGFGPDYNAPGEKFVAPQLRVTTNRFDMNVRYSRVEDTGVPMSMVQVDNFNTTDEFVRDPVTGEPIPWEPNYFYLYGTDNPAVVDDCPPGTPGWHCGPIQNKVASNHDAYSDSLSELATMYASYQISDLVNVRYNFSWSDVKQFTTAESDYTNRVSIPEDHTIASDGLLEGGADTWLNVYYEQPFEYDEISHELTINGASRNGKFNYIGGLFYYDMNDLWQIDKFQLNSTWRFGTADEQARAASPIWDFWPAEGCADTLNMIETFGWGTTDPDRADEFEGLVYYCPEGDDHTEMLGWFTSSETTTRAAFFSGNYRFNANWALSGGLRYTEDEKFQDTSAATGYALFEFGSLVGVRFATGEGAGRPVTWSAPIGHLALEYTTDAGHLIYGRISTGFRAGGFNITEVPGQVPPFIEEETLINYEVGTKGAFFNSRLQIAAGLWYYDFQDYQITATQVAPPDLPPSIYSETPLVPYTANIPDTTVWGGDLEYSAYIGNNWTLRGFYAYQDSEVGPHESVVPADPDAEYGEWEHIDFETGETVTSLYELPSDMTGNTLPMQPKHKFALTGGWNTPLGVSGGDLQAFLTYAYTGSMHGHIGNLAVHEIPSHDRWDASISWTPRGGKWSVSLFGKNLANEIGVVEFTPGYSPGHGPSIAMLTLPRQVGLQLYWRPFN
jgi:iron complex outermembrane receptor protein